MKRTAGFSILELVIVTAITLIITGYLLTRYNDFNEKERVRQAAKVFVSEMRYAQNQALSGV